MKRILNLLALVAIAMTSACALPNAHPSSNAAPIANPPAPAVANTAQSSPQPAPSRAPQVPQAPPTATPPRQYVPGVIAGQAQAQPAGAYPPPSPEPSATATEAPPPEGDIVRLPAYSPHTGEQHAYQNWQKWPVLPVVSQRAIDIYKAGIAAGNDPKHFSKIGDCQVIRQYFLGYFDNANLDYHLGPNLDALSAVLKNFHGSYFRLSMAVRTGFNVASVLSPRFSDTSCKNGQNPLECEESQWNPSIAIISMETWTENRPTAAYEGYLRQIVDYELSQNVLPILATKADNKEGDNSINLMIARVAYEYDLPLWNFWAASYPLPTHGLMDDGFHLTNGDSVLTGDGLKFGWNVRNLTALQALNQVWTAVNKKK